MGRPQIDGQRHAGFARTGELRHLVPALALRDVLAHQQGLVVGQPAIEPVGEAKPEQRRHEFGEPLGGQGGAAPAPWRSSFTPAR